MNSFQAVFMGVEQRFDAYGLSSLNDRMIVHSGDVLSTIVFAMNNEESDPLVHPTGRVRFDKARQAVSQQLRPHDRAELARALERIPVHWDRLPGDVAGEYLALRLWSDLSDTIPQIKDLNRVLETGREGLRALRLPLKLADHPAFSAIAHDLWFSGQEEDPAISLAQSREKHLAELAFLLEGIPVSRAARSEAWNQAPDGLLRTVIASSAVIDAVDIAQGRAVPPLKDAVTLTV